MSKSTEEDREEVRYFNGFFVGSLNDTELASFDRCVADGLASYDYGHNAGFFGLAKVKLNKIYSIDR